MHWTFTPKTRTKGTTSKDTIKSLRSPGGDVDETIYVIDDHWRLVQCYNHEDDEMFKIMQVDIDTDEATVLMNLKKKRHIAIYYHREIDLDTIIPFKSDLEPLDLTVTK